MSQLDILLSILVGVQYLIIMVLLYRIIEEWNNVSLLCWVIIIFWPISFCWFLIEGIIEYLKELLQ